MIDKQISQYKILSTHCKYQGTSGTRYYRDVDKNRNNIIPVLYFLGIMRKKLNNK